MFVTVQENDIGHTHTAPSGIGYQRETIREVLLYV